MNMRDRVVLYSGIWIAVILSAVILYKTSQNKESPRHPNPKQRNLALETNPDVTLAVDTNSNPPSCYADDAWPSLPATNRSDTVNWTAANGDPNTYYITFIGVNPLLTSDGTKPASMPIIVSSGGTPEGPYKISSNAVSACTAAANVTAGACYFSYDIALSNAGPSCVRHYGGGVGLMIGVHLSR